MPATHWTHWGLSLPYRLDYPIAEYVATMQSMILYELLNPMTMQRLHDNELKSASDKEPYTLAEHLRTLCLAIVEQALLDLFEASDNQLAQSRGKAEKPIAAARARREAEQFLLDTEGPWCESRVDVCFAAGIDPEWLCREAWARLEAQTLP